MNQIMKTVKIALYHGSLPEKSYYQKKKNITYLSVEHGLYSLPEPDPIYLAELKLKTAEFSFVLSIPGNIRPEKNYKHVIQCLTELPRFCLIIAGSPANSKVNIQILKDFAFDKGVTRQVIWIEKFLSEAELAAVIKASDLVVLYYAASFQAQSGILHQVIPLKKPVLVSDLPNALTDIVRKFGIGYISEADNPEALLKTLSGIRENPFHPDWEKCINDISWNKQVERVLEFLHDDL
jgi:glycosyltransferase involved in cell wall biosynthesis